MRVLINVNEQISATMMEKHFQASSLEAEVISAPNNMMLEIMKACKIDLVAFYADEVDNNALISFFNATGNVRKILFVKKQYISLVNEELENIFDECFTIPIDSGDLMIRLRRMFRDAEQKSAEQLLPRQEQKPAEQNQPPPVTYIPPTQSAELPPVFVRPETVIQPPPVQNTQEQDTTAEVPEPSIEPINTGFAYTAENFLPQPDDNENRSVSLQEETTPANGIKAQPWVSPDETPAGKKKGKKGKRSPLRYLNKTELLEIILEQEKMLGELNIETAQIKEELDNRNIILDESGSIAEAALKLNNVFEAAQKSADQYLESVKAISVCQDPD